MLFARTCQIDIRPEEVYQAFVKDVSDSFQVEVGDKQDRVIKRVIRFNVESYVPSKVFKFTNTGEIVTMNYEVYLEETNGLQTLESYLAGGGQAFQLNEIPNRKWMGRYRYNLNYNLKKSTLFQHYLSKYNRGKSNDHSP